MPEKERSVALYLITEHRGWRVRQRLFINATDQEHALRASAGGPFRMPPEARTWPYLDDSLGGGALIDPADEDHCLRADPREGIAYPEEEYGTDCDAY